MRRALIAFSLRKTARKVTRLFCCAFFSASDCNARARVVFYVVFFLRIEYHGQLSFSKVKVDDVKKSELALHHTKKNVYYYFAIGM